MSSERTIRDSIRLLLTLASICAALFLIGAAWMLYEVVLERQHDDAVIAARRGDIVALQRLVKRDVFLSRTGFEEHQTPLVAAARAGHTDAVQLLLLQKVDVGVRDDYGKTALAYASEQGHAEIVPLLLRARRR